MESNLKILAENNQFCLLAKRVPVKLLFTLLRKVLFDFIYNMNYNKII